MLRKHGRRRDPSREVYQRLAEHLYSEAIHAEGSVWPTRDGAVGVHSKVIVQQRDI